MKACVFNGRVDDGGDIWLALAVVKLFIRRNRRCAQAG